MKNRILFYSLSILLILSLSPQMVIGNNDNDIVNEITINNSGSDILVLYSDRLEEYKSYIEEMGYSVEFIQINNWKTVNFTDYKLVLSVPDCLSTDPAKFGDAAADYLDQGGRFIGTTFSWQTGCGGNQGRYQVDWSPWLLEGHYFDSVYSGNNSQGNSILDGVNYTKSKYTAKPSEVTLYNGSEVLAYWDSGAPMIAVKDSRSMGLNFLPYYFEGDMKTLLQNAISYIFNPAGIQGIKQLDYNFRAQNIIMPLNITIENGTTYDAYLNGDLIDTQNYQNGTINIDISKLYYDYTYTNYTILNNTKYEYSNLTLAFHTEQNVTYTHFVNVRVYDYLPIFNGLDTMNIEKYEIGTSLFLDFNITDDNPDRLYVYSNDEIIYTKQWSDNIVNLNIKNFIKPSSNLGHNNYTIIFEDEDFNQIEFSLQVNVIDTINPSFTSIYADHYIEGEDNGQITFTVEDTTLDKYAVFVNGSEIENSIFKGNNTIEISNAGYVAGNYEVEVVVYDRANNMARMTTSFIVMSSNNNSTNNNNTITITETNNVTVQGNTSQNVSILESTPIADLPFMLLVSFVGLYVFRKNRK
tara:strand:+ start:42 stop:1784 length:1743 start_codon:yes stop_codon:yes gene_type:complete